MTPLSVSFSTFPVCRSYKSFEEKNKRAIKWLYQELPALVSGGVLSAEDAQKLRDYYGETKTVDTKRTILTIFGIIGSVMIGGGIVLILAHNWADFTRVVRTVLSFLPLLIAQGFVGYVICKRKKSVGWCEGSSVFLMLTVASSIALISQTYHIPADMGNFVLTWMLLSLPLVYLLNSSLTAVLYLIGITTWAGIVKHDGGHTTILWLLGGAFVPHIFLAIKERKYSPRSIILCFASFITSSVAAWLVLEKAMPGLLVIIYSSLFGLYYLSGKFWFDDAPAIWQKPFYFLGALGITVLSFILTYEGVWDDISRTFRSGMIEYAAVSDFILAIGLAGASIFLIVRSIIKKKLDNLPLGVAPLLAILGCGLVYFEEVYDVIGVLPVVIFNIYVLYLGISTLVNGVKTRWIVQINAGLIVISALILMRFFDIDISFVVKGIGFIVIGTGFFVTNYLIIKQMKNEKMLNKDEGVAEDG